jgi:hypothetical protein
MDIRGIPFGLTDWASIPPIEHPGETGTAYWRTCQFGSIRVGRSLVRERAYSFMHRRRTANRTPGRTRLYTKTRYELPGIGSWRASSIQDCVGCEAVHRGLTNRRCRFLKKVRLDAL